MNNIRRAAPLSLLLCMFFSAAAVAGSLVDDAVKMRDSFGFKIYEGALKRQAASGDRWSDFRLREIDKAVDLAQSGKKFEDASWWNPVDKVSTGYAAWKDKNEYFQASKERREYEKKLAEVGITPGGKRSEDAMIGTVRFLGNFSGAAREGAVLIDRMKQVEDSSYKYHTTSWLNPIAKVGALKEFLSDSKDARLQHENFKTVAANDPFVRFGQTVSNLGTTLGGIFGGTRNSGGVRDVYANGGNGARTPGRIRETGSTGAGDFTREIEGATRDLKRSFAELKSSVRELKDSFRGMGRELSRGMGELSASAGTPCTGPGCKPADPTQVNELLDKLRSRGIK